MLFWDYRPIKKGISSCLPPVKNKGLHTSINCKKSKVSCPPTTQTVVNNIMLKKINVELFTLVPGNELDRK